MSRNEEGDNDNRDSSRYGRGSSSSNSSDHSSSSSSFSSGKDGKIDTSKLVSTMIDDEGRFLGMQLSPETAKQLREFLPVGLVLAADYGHDFVSRTAGEKWAKPAGFAIALSEQIILTLKNVVELTTSLSKLNATMKPLARAASKDDLSIAPLTMNNEVIASARSKIMDIFSQRMIDTLVSTIGAAMAIITVAGKKGTEIKSTKALQEMEEAAKTGDPNKLADQMKNSLHSGGKEGTHKGWSAKQISDAEKIVIDSERQLYREAYNDFKTKNLTAVEENLRSELNKLNVGEHEFQLKTLKQLGLPTDSLSQNIANIKRPPYRGQTPKDDAAIDKEIEDAINKFRNSVLSKGKIKQDYVVESIKKKYVREHGAFDSEFKPYDEDSRPTLESELKKQLQALKTQVEEHKKAQVKTEEKEGGLIKKTIDSALAFASGLFREVAQSLIGGKALSQLKKPIASDRIVHLIQIMDSKGEVDWTPPNEVPPISNKEGKRGSDSSDGVFKSVSYSQYITEVFQQNQKDYKRAEVGDRFLVNFKKEKWNDDAIQHLPDEKLSAFEYAIKHITKRIKDGRMAPAALVFLVGDSHGKKLVQSDGQTFGPKGAGKDDAAVKEAILKIIDDNTSSLDKPVTAEQLSEKMSNWLFKPEEVKQVLESKEVDPQWRNFTFKLFSDVIGNEGVVCEKLGIKSERCQELRKASKEFSERLDGLISVLAKNLEENKDKYKELCEFTPTEKELIESLNELRNKRGGHVADHTENPGEPAALMTIALNAAMKLGNQPEFQKEISEAMEELKKPREAAPKKEARSESEHTRSDYRSESTDFDQRDDDNAEHGSKRYRQDRPDESARRPHYEERNGSHSSSHAEKVRKQRHRDEPDENHSDRYEEGADRQEDHDSRSEEYSGRKARKYVADENTDKGYKERVKPRKDRETVAPRGWEQ